MSCQRAVSVPPAGYLRIHGHPGPNATEGSGSAGRWRACVASLLRLICSTPTESSVAAAQCRRHQPKVYTSTISFDCSFPLRAMHAQRGGRVGNPQKEPWTLDTLTDTFTGRGIGIPRSAEFNGAGLDCRLRTSGI